jgi:outer membrane protein assembly factor BamD (BamD/ComL family)
MVRIGTAVLIAVLSVAGCSKSQPESQSSTTVDQSQASGVHPPDPTTESGLYESAQAAEQQGQPAEAIRLYRRILTDYPQSTDNYKAVFLIGFVFSEKLNQPDSARTMFHEVIRDYPTCEFVDDAQAMLRFLDGEMPPFEDAPHS